MDISDNLRSFLNSGAKREGYERISGDDECDSINELGPTGRRSQSYSPPPKRPSNNPARPSRRDASSAVRMHTDSEEVSGGETSGYASAAHQMPLRRHQRSPSMEGRGRPSSLHGIGQDVFINYDERLQQLPDEQRQHGERLRRHLKFFFMDPMQKYKVRKQFPFKLALQILKVAFVTIQVVLFAELRISHVDFLEDTATVMRHKFLKQWSTERDAVAYPPDTGRYAVFTSDEIIEHFAFIVKSYYSLRNESFASFSYDTLFVHNDDVGDSRKGPLEKPTDFLHIPPLKLCIDRLADVNVQNETYIFDVSEVHECFKLNFTQIEVAEIIQNPLTIRDIFIDRNITFKPDDALIISKASVKFNLRTIHFSPVSTDQKPECYLIKITIDFDNSRHTGQVFVDLHSIISYVNLCNGRVLQVGTVSTDTVLIGLVDVCVLVMCIASLLLCCRALVKAHLLKMNTVDFFESVLKQKLSVSDTMDFLNLWYVMIVINDVLIILGTVSKVTIEFRDFDSDLFTLTGIMLGTGALLVYIGLLRYLGFFSGYNVRRARCIISSGV
ncbi:mucolipin 1 [Aphelenchoides avenae]|nr:mucolipin 1 [Aphelenchus avenae]